MIEVDAVRVFGNAIVDEVVQLAREVQPHAVGQVTAVGQIESQNGVANIQRSQVNGLVSLGTRVGLHVGVFGTEEFFGAVARDVFDHVDVLTTTVIATAGIAFCVFVGQHATGSFHDGGAGVVFAGDHLQPILLAQSLIVDGVEDGGVLFLQKLHWYTECVFC